MLKNNNFSLQNKCKDCGIIISNFATRCYKCANKGSFNPNWSGGKKNNYCIDCNKEISKISIRCLSCSKKGLDNPNYKNGLSIIQHYCIDCGKKIWCESERCKSCATSGKNHHNYKDGRTNKIYYCIDCGKQTSSYQTNRCQKCNDRFMVGENHHGWRGGIRYYPLDWSKKFREQIRERDNHTCQLCSKKQGKRKLSVHHIDYDKDNLDTDNLISLCIKCHVKTNYNRDFWKIVLSK